MAYIEWSVRPEVFQLGPLSVRWYGLFFAVLFLIGFAIVRWMFRIEGKDTADMESLLIYVVAGTIIGARLGHVIFYEPDYYLRHPWKILAVWNGGLASHGGTLGVIIAIYLGTRSRPNIPFLWLLDRMSPPTALGAAMIRTGNLFNSEILGKPTDVPWGFIFTRIDTIPRHPAQLYEACCYLFLAIILMFVYVRLKAHTPRGLLTGLLLAGIFAARIAVEFFKEPQAAYESGLGTTVGQWLSIPFVLGGLYLVYRAIRFGKPGPRS